MIIRGSRRATLPLICNVIFFNLIKKRYIYKNLGSRQGSQRQFLSGKGHILSGGPREFLIMSPISVGNKKIFFDKKLFGQAPVAAIPILCSKWPQD